LVYEESNVDNASRLKVIPNMAIALSHKITAWHVTFLAIDLSRETAPARTGK
jgi:hypothetical protein